MALNQLKEELIDLIQASQNDQLLAQLRAVLQAEEAGQWRMEDLSAAEWASLEQGLADERAGRVYSDEEVQAVAEAIVNGTDEAAR